MIQVGRNPIGLEGAKNFLRFIADNETHLKHLDLQVSAF